MSIDAPPRPHRGDARVADAHAPEPPLPDGRPAELEALIEEARERARRRRRRNGAIAALVVAAGPAALSLLDRASSPTLVTENAASAPVIAPGGPSGTIAVTGRTARGTPAIYLWTRRGMREAGISGAAFGWSPDGSRLLVQRGTALDVVRLADRRTVRLTSSGSGFNAAWSPDGARIVFAGSAVPGHAEYRRMFIVRVNGRGTRLLPGWVVDGGFFTGNLTWSPDGREIVFAGRTETDARHGLFRLASDGPTLPRRLAIPVRLRDVSQPAWSPDGSRLAFSASARGSIGDLFVAAGDGSGARRVAAGGTGAVWAPDGSMLAFRTHGDGRTWVARADGTHLTPLPRGPWGGLSWSADSRYIAFPGGAGHSPDGAVYAVEPDGTGLVRLLHRPGSMMGLPLWRYGTASTEAG